MMIAGIQLFCTKEEALHAADTALGFGYASAAGAASRPLSMSIKSRGSLSPAGPRAGDAMLSCKAGGFVLPLLLLSPGWEHIVLLLLLPGRAVVVSGHNQQLYIGLGSTFTVALGPQMQVARSPRNAGPTESGIATQSGDA